MSLDISYLKKIAIAFRAEVENISQTGGDVQFETFPYAACGATSELLARYLNDAIGLKAYFVAARSRNETHGWVAVEDIIIDITADQFEQKPVIVTRKSPWHENWDQEEHRLPRYPENWPTYPSSTWESLADSMKERGFPSPKQQPHKQ